MSDQIRNQAVASSSHSSYLKNRRSNLENCIVGYRIPLHFSKHCRLFGYFIHTKKYCAKYTLCIPG